MFHKLFSKLFKKPRIDKLVQLAIQEGRADGSAIVHIEIENGEIRQIRKIAPESFFLQSPGR